MTMAAMHSTDSLGDSYKVLHSFHGGRDGKYPVGLASDGVGTLYVAMIDKRNKKTFGAQCEIGCEKALSQQKPKNPSIVSFKALGKAIPSASPLFYNGNLYGPTAIGGKHDHGSIYELASDGSGEKTLYSFCP